MVNLYYFNMGFKTTNWTLVIKNSPNQFILVLTSFNPTTEQQTNKQSKNIDFKKATPSEFTKI